MELRKALARITAGQHLTEEEALAVMEEMMTDKATPAQIGAFLVALKMKGETVEEITGMARAMRAKATPLETGLPNIMDTCGTGGDTRNTFNISTTAAFVIAGAGVPVAKHGNRAVSSRCGSADLLEALGVPISLSPVDTAKCLKEVGLAFLFAPVFHQSMRFAAAPRRELGLRTVFNILGPLTNPAGATCQVLGVYDHSLTGVMASVLGRLGCRRAFVCHGYDGTDEVSISGPTRVSMLREGEVVTFDLHPGDAGIATADMETIQGGGPEQNARITMSILEGRKGPCRDVVVLNAGLGLVAAGLAENLREGVDLACYSLDSGKALGKLEALVAFGKGCAA